MFLFQAVVVSKKDFGVPFSRIAPLTGVEGDDRGSIGQWQVVPRHSALSNPIFNELCAPFLLGFLCFLACWWLGKWISGDNTQTTPNNLQIAFWLILISFPTGWLVALRSPAWVMDCSLGDGYG